MAPAAAARPAAPEGFRAALPPHPLARLALLGVWLALVGFMAWHHVFWRDEVRALSFAIQGDSLAAMFRTLRGDGHPLVWFLILRAGHAVIGASILPVAAHLVGLASVALLLWRAPFAVPTLALLVVSHVMTWEFAVMARNYGISMLAMFAFAACYRDAKERGLWLVVPLVLLANTNVHSVVLAWLLLGVWMLDRWPGRAGLYDWLVRLVLPAGAILSLASLACFLTVWPSINDLATMTVPVTPLRVARAVFLPGNEFMLLDDGPLWLAVFATVLLASFALSLWDRPHYLLAALAGLVILALLFAVVYSASNRHRDLWLVFVIALNWMMRDGQEGPEPAGRLNYVMRRIGFHGLHLMLLIQLAMTVEALSRPLRTPPLPSGRAQDLGLLLARDPALHGAIVIADGDHMIEALPYYTPHTPVWRIRQGGYSAVNIFTAHGARVDITLDDVTGTAARLHGCTGRPVVILMQDPPVPGETITRPEAYAWTTRITPAMTARFYAATRLVTRFGPAKPDETYAVYRYRPGSGFAEPAPASAACAVMRDPATSAAAGWRQP